MTTAVLIHGPPKPHDARARTPASTLRSSSRLGRSTSRASGPHPGPHLTVQATRGMRPARPSVRGAGHSQGRLPEPNPARRSDPPFRYHFRPHGWPAKVPGRPGGGYIMPHRVKRPHWCVLPRKRLHPDIPGGPASTPAGAPCVNEYPFTRRRVSPRSASRSRKLDWARWRGTRERVNWA